jgi:GTPase SAR1 family protein
MILFFILILVIIVIAIEIKEFRKKPIKREEKMIVIIGSRGVGKTLLTEKLVRDREKKDQHHSAPPKLCDQYKGGAAPNSNNPPPNTGSK